MTYSLAVTGANANSIPLTEILTLADSAVQGGATVTIPTPGGMERAMRLNYIFLAKGRDGVESLYRLDAERSTPDIPVLLKV